MHGKWFEFNRMECNLTIAMANRLGLYAASSSADTFRAELTAYRLEPGAGAEGGADDDKGHAESSDQPNAQRHGRQGIGRQPGDDA